MLPLLRSALNGRRSVRRPVVDEPLRVCARAELLQTDEEDLALPFEPFPGCMTTWSETSFGYDQSTFTGDLLAAAFGYGTTGISPVIHCLRAVLLDARARDRPGLTEVLPTTAVLMNWTAICRASGGSGTVLSAPTFVAGSLLNVSGGSPARICVCQNASTPSSSTPSQPGGHG